MLKPSLQLKLGQTLTMTPQLQQAIRLLQLPVLDLNAQIQEALEENIMLEMEDLPDLPRTEAETTAEVETIKADDMWQTRSAERVQDGGWNGTLGKCEFYVGNSPDEFGDAVATHTFTKSRKAQDAKCPATKGRYVRLRVLSEVNGNAWASIAELGVIGR